VWFGERPYIITAEGNRYYEGAFLDNGWTIKDIADGRILLAKDGETRRWSFVSKVRAERTDRLG
jgi:hypothetical protein